MDLLGGLRYRLFGRCWACNRLMALHLPRRRRRCDDMPIAAVVVVPESRAISA